MIARALPTWILMRWLIRFLPPCHPWATKTFTLREWYEGQTILCAYFDAVVWAYTVLVTGLVYRLLSA